MPRSGPLGAPIDKNKPVEIQVLDFRSPNKISGRTYLYDVSIFLVTKAEHQEKVKGVITEREALIKDRDSYHYCPERSGKAGRRFRTGA